MADGAFTPGPWQAGQSQKGRWSVYSTGVLPHHPIPTGAVFCGWRVALVDNGAPGDTLDTEEANARLIAAAPDLLAACEAARAFGSQGDTHDGLSVSEMLRAAVAKARGEAAP